MIIRKATSILALATVILSLTACGEGDNGQPDNSDRLTNGIQTSESYSNNEASSSLNSEDTNNENTNTENTAFVPDPVNQPDIWEVLPEIPLSDAGDFKYKLDSEAGGIVVTYYTGDKTAVRIPDSFDGEAVVKVELNNCKKSLTELIMPDSVKSYQLSDEIKLAVQYINVPAGITELADYSFSGWKSLLAVYLPDGITTIGKFVFDGCESLENITLPGSVTSISGAVFSLCTSLTNINAVNGGGNYCSADGLLFEKTADGGISLRKCSAGRTGNVIIPDGTTAISKSAFDYCQKITGVTFPKSMTAIGEKAFADCISLKNITFTGGSIELGDRAFLDCTGLTDVTMPDSVTNIEDSFYGCNSIKATYKGKTYTYSEIDDLYNAINSN